MALPLLLLSAASLAAGQSGCLQLTGSSACPEFASQYINPSNVSSTYSFLSSVTDVTSFDAALFNYLNTTFRTVKYNQELGCSNNDPNWTLQYARTFLCGELTTRSYQAGCTNVPYERMTCQATCLQFAFSENLLVSNATACGSNTIGSARQGNLTYDFTTCTQWTSLITNNTATCVLGQNNEPNCGFAQSTYQLCDYCNPNNKNGQLVDSCCAGSNVNLGSCGYTLQLNEVAASPTPSSVPASLTASMTGMSSSSSSSAGAAAGAGADNTGSMSTSGSGGGLSKGAIAGIVIGSVVGGLLILALLLFLLARRRRSTSDANRNRAGSGGLLAGAAGASGYDSEKAGLSSKEALAAKQKKLDAGYSPPSPLSSATLGLSHRDSEDSRAMLASGASSPSLATVAAGALASHAVVGAGRTGGERPISQDTTGTGSSSNDRNLVPSVRDQYSSADIVPGSEVVAIYAYEPNLPDELKLQPDSVVTVKKIYDDGWAVGTQQNADGTIAEGAFPLVVCTVVGADSDHESSNSSHMVTASEAGGQSGTRQGRSGSSRRTSSIGDTSFESAASHAPTTSTTRAGGGGAFGNFFRRGTGTGTGSSAH